MVQWDASGREIRRGPSPRIYDLKITADGTKIVAVCTKQTLHVYDFLDWKNHKEYNMGSGLTGVFVSKDSRHAIVNTAAREVVMVDVEAGRVVQRYFGQVQDHWVIRGCLGGTDEGFVVSGSEGEYSWLGYGKFVLTSLDSNVYVWQKDTGQLVETLEGHDGPVNCVAWNPVNPYIFASAGDDRTIRM